MSAVSYLPTVVAISAESFSSFDGVKAGQSANWELVAIYILTPWTKHTSVVGPFWTLPTLPCKWCEVWVDLQSSKWLLLEFSGGFNPSFVLLTALRMGRRLCTVWGWMLWPGGLVGHQGPRSVEIWVMSMKGLIPGPRHCPSPISIFWMRWLPRRCQMAFPTGPWLETKMARVSPKSGWVRHER